MATKFIQTPLVGLNKTNRIIKNVRIPKGIVKIHPATVHDGAIQFNAEYDPAKAVQMTEPCSFRIYLPGETSDGQNEIVTVVIAPDGTTTALGTTCVAVSKGV